MKKQEAPSKFEHQDALYSFPYHYIPHFDSDGTPSRQRFLNWGFEYLCYMLHVVTIIDELEPDSLLDVGCGDGRLFSLLGVSPDRQVGADLSRKAIRHARAFNPSVEFKVCDAGHINEEFDVVTAVEVLEHIPDEKLTSFVEGAEERLNSGGHFIVSVPSTVRPVQSKHYRHYDLARLRDQIESLSDRLALVRGEYIYRESLLIRLWERLSRNPIWTVEVHVFKKIVWRWIWNQLRHASADDGCHVVAVYRKG